MLESNGFPRNIYNGVPFVTIPALKAPIGDIEIAASGDVFPRFGAFPVEAAVDTFQIASQEVTTDEFAVFLRDMPYWSEANKDALIGAGFVDNNYLQAWSGSLPPAGRGDYPLTDVSWHAAMAYADWLTDQIFPDGGGRVRLPREDEWEIAARIDSGLGDASEIPGVIEAAAEAAGGEIGLLGMIGNVREWCYNPFRYNENRFRPPSGSPAYLDADSKLAGGERVVRGAAFIDADLPYPAAVRGSLKAHQTSPVVGFRVLIPSR